MGIKHHVYFVQAGGKNRPIKIGVARDVSARIAELQIAHYDELRVLASIVCDSERQAFALEGRLHRLFRRHHIRGEWFGPAILKRMWALEARWRAMTSVAETGSAVAI